MIARSVNAAADVIHRAQVNGAQTAAGLAMALESAQLLVSPEMARRMAELEQMETRLKALLPTEPLPLVMLGEGAPLRAARAVWEQVAAVVGVELPTRPRVEESAGRLRALLAPSDDPCGLHHEYRLGRDLPGTGGAR